MIERLYLVGLASMSAANLHIGQYAFAAFFALMFFGYMFEGRK